MKRAIAVCVLVLTLSLSALGGHTTFDNRYCPGVYQQGICSVCGAPIPEDGNNFTAAPVTDETVEITEVTESDTEIAIRTFLTLLFSGYWD